MATDTLVCILTFVASLLDSRTKRLLVDDDEHDEYIIVEEDYQQMKAGVL